MLIRTAPIPGVYTRRRRRRRRRSSYTVPVFAAAHNLHLYLSPPPTDGTGIITLGLFEFNGHYACSLLKRALCAFRPPPAPTNCSRSPSAAKGASDNETVEKKGFYYRRFFGENCHRPSNVRCSAHPNNMTSYDGDIRSAR